MTTHTHQTAPTQFVEAKGIRFAYRRFGKASGVPLVFNMHFTGTMEHWDPLVTDGFAKDREVILFDNAGVSSSSGEVPTSVERMAANALAFIKALGLSQVDVLGFSLGGQVGRPARKPLRLSEGDPSTDAGHQRPQRRDRLHDQLVHPPAEHPQRPADPLPGRQSRLAVPVPGTVCPARLDVPVRRRRVSTSRFRMNPSIKELHS